MAAAEWSGKGAAAYTGGSHRGFAISKQGGSIARHFAGLPAPG